MPRGRPPGHIYSVFVPTVTSEAMMTTEMVYFGNSEFAAQLKLAKAILVVKSKGATRPHPLGWK